MNLQRMRQLAGLPASKQLTEGVSAIPGIGPSAGRGTESDMQTSGTVGRDEAYGEFDASQDQPTEEGIELGDDNDTVPSYYVVDGDDYKIMSGPYTKDEYPDIKRYMKTKRWFDPNIHTIEFGIEDDGVFMPAEGWGDDDVREDDLDDIEFDQLHPGLEEMSPETISGYMKGAADDMRHTNVSIQNARDFRKEMPDKEADWADEEDFLQRHLTKRTKGVATAATKMARVNEGATACDMEGINDMNDMRKLINLMEGITAVPGTGRIVNEEIDTRYVEELTAMLSAGEISYEEFRDKLDSADYTDYSMRQGENGMMGADTPAGHRADMYNRDQEAGERTDGLDDEGYEDEDEDEDETDYERSHVPGRNVSEDLQNGYGEEKYADGADTPAGHRADMYNRSVGPSGARHGDNPEQKKMEVTETHKELVYAYRNFLKESKVTKK